MVMCGAVLLALTVSACGGGQGDATQSGGQSGHSTIKWAIQTGNPANIPLLMAEETGVLDKHGIKLQRVAVTGGGANQIAAAVSGSADFFLAVPDLVAASTQAGQDVNIFCGMIPNTPLPMVATPDSQLKTFGELGDWNATIQQFKGMKLGVPARGSAYELRTTAILESGGLSARDVTYIPVGVGPSVKAALQSGQVDGMLAYGFLPSQFEQEGLAEVITDANADGPASLAGHFSTGLAASGKWLADHPREAEALCSALSESAELIMQPEQKPTLERLLASEAGVTREQMDDAVAFVTDDYYSTEIDRAGVEKVLALLVEGGGLKPSPAVTYDDIVQPLSR